MEKLDALRQTLPDHSKDLKLNIQSVLSQSKLEAPRLWGCALASAVATGDDELVAATLADAEAAGVAAESLEDARAAASLMAMNNVYYRFRHFMGGSYDDLPARLRMNRIARPASNKVDFELFSLVVSAINGCEMCVQSHEKVVIEGGVTREQVHDAVRIGAVVAGLATGLRQR
ncbi:MAG: carboxymuconolactone decarboxylase family protein [Myxococcota bacterium]